MSIGKSLLGLSYWALTLAIAAPEQRIFGDALASCDNLGHCSILAVSDEGDEDLAWLVFEREAGAEAIQALSIRSPRGAPPDRRWRLHIDERLAHVVAPDEIHCAADDTPGLCEGVDLEGAERVDTLIRALLDADRLTVSADGAPLGSVSLRGIKAAALWIDERQRRLDTRSALVRRGERAFTPPAWPAAPTLPASTDAWQEQPADQQRLDRARAALAAADCDRRATQADRLWRHREGRWLAALSCRFGPYWAASLWLWSEDGRRWRPLPLSAPLAGDEDEALGLLRDAQFDETLGTLVSIARSRGVGDCGVERHFVDTGREFALYLERRMPLCRGLPMEAWPVLYRAILAD